MQTVVSYEVRQSELHRTQTSANEVTHRDSFRFPDSYRLEFGHDAANLVSLTAFATPHVYLSTNQDGDPHEEESDVRRPVMHIDCGIGRDHRFHQVTDESFP